MSVVNHVAILVIVVLHPIYGYCHARGGGIVDHKLVTIAELHSVRVY